MASSDDEYNQMVGEHKPGSITKITMKNFLTHGHVEFEPGPRLNMVVGANGTGKSTILCAICLGLGGEPKMLGRADDARAFIMHEKNVAFVEITLAPHPGKTVHTFQRKIDRQKGSERGNGRGASTFYINDKKVTIKDVQKLVKETYHISIDNLCTFLPQDKVGSFSGFDQQTLLIETEKTLSRNQHLYNQHIQLIEAENEMDSGGHNVDTIQSKLDKLNSEKERFERAKEMMEERDKAKEQADLLRKKIMWLEFNELQAEVVALKEEKKRLKEQFKKSQEELEPLQKDLQAKEKRMEQLESKYKALDQQSQREQNKMKKFEENIEKIDDKIEGASADLKQIDSDRNLRMANCEKLREKHASIQKSMSQFPAFGEIEKEFHEATQDKKAAHRACSTAKNECGRLHREFKDIQDEAGRVEAKLSKLQDEKRQRKDRFFRSNAEPRKAFEWLEQNRKNFRRPVWGPVAIEVSVTSANSAAFLEHQVSKAMLKTFVVEDKADYDLLYDEIRNKRNIPINITLVKNGVLKPITRIYGDAKMATLKRDHGVIGYLDEMFTAPDAVMQALRSTAQVHKILVGGEKTQKSIDDRGLLEFLSEPDASLGQTQKQTACIIATTGHWSKMYRSEVSRYSKQISSRIDDIQHPTILAAAGNPEEKRGLETQLEEFHNKLKGLRPSIEDAENEKVKAESEGQTAAERYNRAKETKELYSKYKTKLATAASKLKSAEEDLQEDDGSKKKALVKQIMELVDQSINAVESQARSHHKLLEFTISSAGMRISKDSVSVQVRQARDALLEKNRANRDLEQAASQASQEYQQKYNRLKAMQTRNSEQAPMTDALRNKLEELGIETIEDAEAALEEAEQRMNSIHHDPNAIKQYEDTIAEIEQVQAHLEQVQGSKEAWDRKIQQIKAPWKQALENSVAKVNALFENYMKEVGCTGQVRLKRGGDSGDDDKEFKKWGIEIRVSFREGVKSQVLSAQVQSGGERSVSTIMYLMALQEMMVAPFRCVDEINQGLDERNERLVFRRIVQNSTRPPNDSTTDHSGQYFLITPKLLPNMVDMENEAVTLLFVMNGPFNFGSPTDFSVDAIVAAAERFGKKRSVPDSDGDDENHEPNMPATAGRAKKTKKRRSG